MVSNEFLQRLQEEVRSKKYSNEIICPYCNHEQDSETRCEHVSYWGEDSQCKITCEHCNKEFWVEERVERTFITTTIEWQSKEDIRLSGDNDGTE